MWRLRRRWPGRADRTASLRDTLTAKTVLLVGGDPTNQSPATAWNLRTAVRNNGAKLYVANTEEIKLRRQAKAFVQPAAVWIWRACWLPGGR